MTDDELSTIEARAKPVTVTSAMTGSTQTITYPLTGDVLRLVSEVRRLKSERDAAYRAILRTAYEEYGGAATMAGCVARGSYEDEVETAIEAAADWGDEISYDGGY